LSGLGCKRFLLAASVYRSTIFKVVWPLTA